MFGPARPDAQQQSTCRSGASTPATQSNRSMSKSVARPTVMMARIANILPSDLRDSDLIIGQSAVSRTYSTRSKCVRPVSLPNALTFMCGQVYIQL
jgi:hypothetical protein